jgi:hypothetical protein
MARILKKEVMLPHTVKAGNYHPQNSVAEELPTDWISEWNGQQDCLY